MYDSSYAKFFTCSVYLFDVINRISFHSDRIRQDKVKRIYSEAFAQQGELKAMERKKKR